MVSKLSFQAFPTAVNIYAAYEHHNKHGRSRSVLLQVNIQYSQDDSSQNRTIFRSKRTLLALGDRFLPFVCFIGSGIGLSLSMPLL